MVVIIVAVVCGGTLVSSGAMSGSVSTAVPPLAGPGTVLLYIGGPARWATDSTLPLTVAGAYSPVTARHDPPKVATHPIERRVPGPHSGVRIGSNRLARNRVEQWQGRPSMSGPTTAGHFGMPASHTMPYDVRMRDTM
jgi:hypothetical protein